MRASQRIRAAGAVVAVVAGLWAVAGCGPAGPKTHPVRGRVEVAGGDVAHLAGATIEAAQDADPTVRASGVIEPDGTFALQTLHGEDILKGAQAGSYKARLIFADDLDRDARRLQRAAVHARYLKFESSGLTFQVPTDSEVVLRVTPAK